MEWYYASNGQQMGPVPQEELISLFERGEIKASDLVWNEGMPDWVAFSSVPELKSQSVSTDPGGPGVPPSMPQESAVLTPVAGAGAAAVGTTEKVPTYLWQSIVCLVLCCLPAAIPALVFATKVEPALKSGDVAAAKEASSKAKMWCWIAFGVGIAVNIVAFLIGIAGAVAEQA